MLNILSTFLQRYINSSADLLGHFIWKTRSSYPFIDSVFQLVESAPFIFLKPEKGSPYRPVWGEPPPPVPQPWTQSLQASLEFFTNFVTNSSKIEGNWIVSSKGKVPKTFCHKMAWRTDLNPWVILLLLHQTAKSGFKGSFYLWESNNNKFFTIRKLNPVEKVRFEIPWKLTTSNINVHFWRITVKNNNFWRLTRVFYG